MDNRLIPDNFGEFITLRDQTGAPIELGSGGFGTTIRVNRPRAIGGRDFGRDYALKILHGQAIQDRKRREQFLSEIKALGALDHGNIVKYEDCGEENGLVYLVMQLCSGGDLERFVRDFGAFSERTALQVALQVCDGLREAHRKNYLHRDIKPRNVLLVESVPPTADLQWFEEGMDEGKLCFKVVDFGLAGRLDHEVKTTGFAGSPMFCSPEQVRERELDARCDIYSLGMTLWYLVQGRGPLLRADGRPIGDSREAMSAHTSPNAHDDRFPPGLAPEFRAVLSRMLRKSPEQRFSSVNELSQAIRRVLESDALPRTTSPASLQSAEPGEVPLDEQPDYGKGDPEDLYPQREEYGRRSLGKFYRAIPRNSTEAVGLTAWDSMASPDAPQERELAQKLQRIKRVTCSQDAPSSLTSIEDVHRTASSWCIAEEWHDGVPLSELVACRGRSLSLEEIAQLLMPVADAADFLLANEIDNAMLTLGDIRLCGAGISPADRSWLALPVDRWGDWRIQLSALAVPADLTSTVESSTPSSGTISSSLFIDTDSTLSIGKAFCRLFYRMGEGSEVAAAADWDEYSYTEANRLSAASNVLLRRVICGAEAPKSVSDLLRKICTNEGVYRLPSSALTTGMRRTSSVRTSSLRGSDSRAPVEAPEPPPVAEVEPEEEVRGGEEETPTLLSGEDLGLETIAYPTEPPAVLSRGSSFDRSSSPSDSIDVTQQRSVPIVGPSIALDVEVAQIVEGAVGRVRSPYGGRHEQEISGPAWRSNGQIYCAETNRPFRLPRNLPPLEAELIAGRFDAVRSPYWDPPVEFPVPLGRWVAGGEITCEQTGLPLRLPSNLPLPVGIVAPGRPGTVRSPYSDQPEVTIQPEDWTPGQKCVCTATGQFFTLPASIPPLHAVPSEAPGVFTSPYAPEQRMVLQPHECVAGARCECPATGKPLVVPANFPPSWRFEGRVRQTQVPEAQSPFVTASESQYWQPVGVEQWAPGAVLRCTRTQREFTLPGALPLLGVSPAPNAPAVFSPFPPHQSAPVPIEFWKPGNVFTLTLPGGSCRVALPEGELLPVTAQIADTPGRFTSPYALGQSFELPAWDCVRGKTIACPVSGERLMLPSEFPETWQWSGEVRQAKVPEARSPFVKEDERAWVPVAVADWSPRAKIRCRVTGREFLLPAELPALRVAVGPTEPSILSPFPPHEPVPVANSDWRRNAEITVPLAAGKPCRVILPGDILPLGRADLEDLGDLPMGLDPQIRSRRGAIRSPHGRKPWVEVASRDWLPGMRLTCPSTRRQFWLPAELPPLEARLGPRPGSVWSPYTDQAVEIPPDQWVAGDTVQCPSTQGLFVLPAELPLLVGNVDEKRPGFVESPFAPGEWIKLVAAQWRPSAEIPCPSTGRAFSLPAQLPEFIADVELESPLGMVRSPYNERNSFRVRGEDWVAGGYVQCTATGQRARLPDHLPPLTATLVEARPGYILTPYVATPTPKKVASMAWREGGIIECPETGRPLQLPSLLPTLPSLPLTRRPLVLAIAAVAVASVLGVLWMLVGSGEKPEEKTREPSPIIVSVTPMPTPVSTPKPNPAPQPTPIPPPGAVWPERYIFAAGVSPLPTRVVAIPDGGGERVVVSTVNSGASLVVLLGSDRRIVHAGTLQLELSTPGYRARLFRLSKTVDKDERFADHVELERETGRVILTGTALPFYGALKFIPIAIESAADLPEEKSLGMREFDLPVGKYRVVLIGKAGSPVKADPITLNPSLAVGTGDTKIDLGAGQLPKVLTGFYKNRLVYKSYFFRAPSSIRVPRGVESKEWFDTWSPAVLVFKDSFESGTFYEAHSANAYLLVVVEELLNSNVSKNDEKAITANTTKFVNALAFPADPSRAMAARSELLEAARSLRKLRTAPLDERVKPFQNIYDFTLAINERPSAASWKNLMEACVGTSPLNLSALNELTNPVPGAASGYLASGSFQVGSVDSDGTLYLEFRRHDVSAAQFVTEPNRTTDWKATLHSSPVGRWKLEGKWQGDDALIELHPSGLR